MMFKANQTKAIPIIVNVCFRKGKNKYWWDWFTGKYKHCFIAIMDTKLMIYDFRFDGMYIAEATDDDFIDVDIVQVEVKYLCVSGYRPLLTCADFCGSLIGVKGIIITPNRLRRKLNGSIFSTKGSINSTSRVRS